MKKLLMTKAAALSLLMTGAQNYPEVRTVHESKKVAEWAEPQDVGELIYMGPVPVTWDNNSIAKPKMTCVLVGGNILYKRQNGGYDAYSSYRIDESLISRHLKEKPKFKVLEKLSITYGPQGYRTEKQDSWATFEGVSREGDRVFLTGKIPGESVKRFLVTRANDYQWVIKTHEDKRIINYIIQVN